MRRPESDWEQGREQDQGLCIFGRRRERSEIRFRMGAVGLGFEDFGIKRVAAQDKDRKRVTEVGKKRLAAKKGGCDTAETEKRRPEQEERV